MQYMGGKARIAKKLSEVMLSMTTNRVSYLEPFAGACSVLSLMAPHFRASVGGDNHPDLIMMWEAVQNGWTPPDISRERYAELKTAPPSAERAFAGFGCSFGGKWFGGYDGQPGRPGRGFQTASQIARNGIGRKRNGLRDVVFAQSDYRAWMPRGIVYCDPPYDGATGYGVWDSEEFWSIAEQWSFAGATVFVSEYSAPPEWRCVWSGNQTSNLGASVSTVTEKLFTR